MSCGYILGVSALRYFVSPYSIYFVPIVVRGIHALQYIQIAIQYTKLCYSTFELSFWTMLFGKSLARNNKINVKGFKKINYSSTPYITTIIHMKIQWKICKCKTSWRVLITLLKTSAQIQIKFASLTQLMEAQFLRERKIKFLVL